ncbi:hypothetical protein QYE76_046691 [Lolium multiflorum]|uniref:Uncharacterized protein n=1 Tax=Lolium multiflorum TaxID=4521 RepID=A0AAD8TPZ4_LOLMU|nr:hypothetical protein QYE76_046691 [Lolium multiflorum]
MAAEDLEWERSKISNQDTNMLKRLGLMKKEGAIRFPSEESYPEPPIEYRPMIKELLRIGSQFVGYREYATRAEEKLSEANERVDALAQKLEQSEAARKKAELAASKAKAEVDEAKVKAASVEELQRRLKDAESALNEQKTAQTVREQEIIKRLKSQSRPQTNQDFDLENPVNDPLLDALSLLEFHGREIREGVANASASLSALFPYFFPKKEEPSTFLALAKLFNSSEDLGLKMRHENMKLIFDNYTPTSAPSNVSPSSRARRAFADTAPVDDIVSQELDELRQQLQSTRKQSLKLMEQSRESSEKEKIALQQAQTALAEKDSAVAECWLSGRFYAPAANGC